MTDSSGSTLVAPFVGVVVAASILGGTYGQTAYYFLHQRDAWPHHTLVIVVTISDTTHQALIAYTMYSYLVLGGQSLEGRSANIWSLPSEAIFNGIIAFLVQGYLVRRIWTFSERSRWITFFVVPLIVIQFGSVLAFGIYSLITAHTYEELRKIRSFYVVINALSAGADLLIAGVSTGLLVRSKTGYLSTERMITYLVGLSVHVGALTALCALGSLISILVWGHSFVCLAFFFCTGRLYANAFLATLNSRARIRRIGELSMETRDSSPETDASVLEFRSGRLADGDVSSAGTSHRLGGRKDSSPEKERRELQTEQQNDSQAFV